MMKDYELVKKKWDELVDFAKQHATKEGLRTGVKWLQDSFEEYLKLADATPGYGMGGRPGSDFNREVLAGRILEELDGIGSGHPLDEEQLSRLKASLNEIVNSIPNQLKR